MSRDPHLARTSVTEVPTRNGGVIRWIELRRPEKLNCLSLAMLDDLLRALRGGETAAAVVLTAAGRSFCSGLDLNEIGGAAHPDLARATPHLERLASVYRWFLRSRVPTIVLAQGYAAGGGAGLAAAARRVVVSSDFRLKLPAGRLARLASIAFPLLELRAPGKSASNWLGCELGALEAKRLGLVDAVVPASRLDDLVEGFRRGEIATELADAPPRADAAVARALSGLDRLIQRMVSPAPPIGPRDDLHLPGLGQ